MYSLIFMHVCTQPLLCGTYPRISISLGYKRTIIYLFEYGEIKYLKAKIKRHRTKKTTQTWLVLYSRTFTLPTKQRHYWQREKQCPIDFFLSGHLILTLHEGFKIKRLVFAFFLSPNLVIWGSDSQVGKPTQSLQHSDLSTDAVKLQIESSVFSTAGFLPSLASVGAACWVISQ